MAVKRCWVCGRPVAARTPRCHACGMDLTRPLLGRVVAALLVAVMLLAVAVAVLRVVAWG
jgi:hypothetical protein